MIRLLRTLAVVVPAWMLSPALAHALDGLVDGRTVPEWQVAVDTMWTFNAAALIFLMQPGFALLESGFARAKNTINIMMKNIADFAISAVGFWMLGFAIMFGHGNGLLGTTGFFVSPGTDDLYPSLSGTSVPTLIAWLFQLMFCATTATIVAGAMAERMRFVGYLVFSFFVSVFFYPLVGHWVWGGGWLAGLGFVDFAGSTVVHSTGGWLALIGVIVLGPRIGKFSDQGVPRALPGHNMTSVSLGMFLLWFGWFGFNAGSTMGVDLHRVATIASNTALAGAGGGISGTVAAWILFGKPDVTMTVNGILASLVAVTGSCAFVEPGVTVIFYGLLPGVVVVFSVLMFDRIRVDDPVGAISVHGVNGALGTVLLGLFHFENGLLYGGGPALLLAQAMGVVTIFSFCMIGGLVLFGAIKGVWGLRVSPETEAMGLDMAEHGNEAYPEFREPDVAHNAEGGRGMSY